MVRTGSHRRPGFLDGHDDIGLLGGAYRAFDGTETGRLRQPPERHTEIRTWLVFKNVLCHPGMVWFAERSARPASSSTGIWLDRRTTTSGCGCSGSLVAPIFAGLAVLYRRHTTTMSATFESDMPSEVERISNRQLEELLGADTPDLDDLRAMRRLWRANQLIKGDLSFVSMIDSVFERLAMQPDIEEAEIGESREEWMRRVMSGSLQMSRRPPWQLMRSEPRAAARWVTTGLCRNASARLRDAQGIHDAPSK